MNERQRGYIHTAAAGGFAALGIVLFLVIARINSGDHLRDADYVGGNWLRNVPVSPLRSGIPMVGRPAVHWDRKPSGCGPCVGAEGYPDTHLWEGK